jgi:hypothetical protein
MSRGRVTFSAANSNAAHSSRTDRQHAEFLKHHQSHGMTLHGGFGNHRRPRAVLSEQDYYEERIWDVKRTKQEFIQQELFMPTYAETMSLLNDIHDNLLHEPGHLNYDDYCEFCKEALRSSGLAPKQQEMKQLFHLIDEDHSASLERHEILHAVMANWEVKRLLQNSKTLKPLGSVAAWKRAFEKLKQPNRRLAASNTLLRISSNETCARAICEFQRDHKKNSHVNDHAVGGGGGGGGGGTSGVWNQATGMYDPVVVRRPILAALAPLLTIGKGKEIAINVAGVFGNLAWHVPELKLQVGRGEVVLGWWWWWCTVFLCSWFVCCCVVLQVPDNYFNYFWVASGDQVAQNELMNGGYTIFLCNYW